MAGTRLELSSEGGFTEQHSDDSFSSGAEQQINSTEIKRVNTWATLDHPYITRQGEEPPEERDNVRGFGETHGEKIGKLRTKIHA